MSQQAVHEQTLAGSGLQGRPRGIASAHRSAHGCWRDDVNGTLRVTQQFLGQRGVEYLCDFAVPWSADDDHARVVFISEIGNATAGATVAAYDSKEVARTVNSSHSEPVEGLGHDFVGCLRRLRVDGKLFQDVGLHDVEDLDRRIKQASKLDDGIHYWGRFRAAVDGRDDRKPPVCAAGWRRVGDQAEEGQIAVR